MVHSSATTHTLMQACMWPTAGIVALMAPMNAFRYAARVLHRVVTVQLVIEKLDPVCTEGRKAAGMKAMELFGGYNSILSIVRSRSSVASAGKGRG